jgi:hypothetical protein
VELRGLEPLAGHRDSPYLRSWPLLLLALPAAVAVWSGWVGIGQMTGFGQVHPLPGLWPSLHLNTAITLPVGVEAYAAYALRAWLTASANVSARTRRFARRRGCLGPRSRWWDAGVSAWRWVLIRTRGGSMQRKDDADASVWRAGDGWQRPRRCRGRWQRHGRGCGSGNRPG